MDHCDLILDVKNRRNKFAENLENNSLTIITSFNKKNLKNNYSASANLYYLTGFAEAMNAAIVIIKEQSDVKFILYADFDKTCESENWDGCVHNAEKLAEKYLIDDCRHLDELKIQLKNYALNKEIIYYEIGNNNRTDKLILDTIKEVKYMTRKHNYAPYKIFDISKELKNFRVKKSKFEIELMKKAAEITSKAFVRLMQKCKPEMYEYQLEAELIHEFYINGALEVAYKPIFGSGKNSCILHYSDNNKKILDGELVLVDAGCEYMHYASDVTRTFPANKKFSHEQKAIYSIVLDAQLECIKLSKPGSSFEILYNESVKIITEGLKNLGLLKGNLNDLIDTKAYEKFYMHGIGHFLGLDVHDFGFYHTKEGANILQKDMLHTIEPGIYISENTVRSLNLDPIWNNIGVRIEDDILITETGCEVITTAPKNIEEIENITKFN